MIEETVLMVATAVIFAFLYSHEKDGNLSFKILWLFACLVFLSGGFLSLTYLSSTSYNALSGVTSYNYTGVAYVQPLTYGIFAILAITIVIFGFRVGERMLRNIG